MGFCRVCPTWLTTAADDAGVMLLVAPSVIDVAVLDAREPLTWRGWVCTNLAVATPAEDTF